MNVQSPDLAPDGRTAVSTFELYTNV